MPRFRSGLGRSGAVLGVVTLFAALSSTLAATRSVRSAAQASDSSDVANAVHAFDWALSTGDSAGVLALLADDAVVLESGGVETRGEYRAHHLPADIQFARTVPSESGDVHVKVVGDVAWAWSTFVTKGAFRGRRVNSMGAELMVLSRVRAGWKINAIHWSSRARRP